MIGRFGHHALLFLRLLFHSHVFNTSRALNIAPGLLIIQLKDILYL